VLGVTVLQPARGPRRAPEDVGERVSVGRAPGIHPVVEYAAVPPPATGEMTLAATLGPRAGWFDEAVLATLLARVLSRSPGNWTARAYAWTGQPSPG
jgi:hypothetical protein